MRSIKAGLLRLSAQASEESPARVLLAALARAAGMREDLWARLSYVEGLSGFSPGSLQRDPGVVDDARDALATGADNRIVDELRFGRRMSDRDISLLLGSRDTGLFDTLLAAVGTIITQPIRGLVAEDVAMALAGGISPLTGNPLKYGKGKGIFYWLGETAPENISLKGIKNITFLEAKNRAKDVTRGTSFKERTQVSLDAPVGTGEDFRTLGDTLQSEGDVSRANFVDLAAAIYQDPFVMGVIDQAVRDMLGGPVQLAIWQAIRANPDFIKVSNNDIGVESRALAKEVSAITGSPYMGKSSDVSVGQIFRQKVWPAMKEAIEDDAVSARLIKNRHILELIQDSTKRPPNTHEHLPAGKPQPDRPLSEVRTLPNNTVTDAPRVVNSPVWLKRLRSDPDLHALRSLGLKRASGEEQVLEMSLTLKVTYPLRYTLRDGKLASFESPNPQDVVHALTRRFAFISEVSTPSLQEVQKKLDRDLNAQMGLGKSAASLGIRWVPEESGFILEEHDGRWWREVGSVWASADGRNDGWFYYVPGDEEPVGKSHSAGGAKAALLDHLDLQF